MEHLSQSDSSFGMVRLQHFPSRTDKRQLCSFAHLLPCEASGEEIVSKPDYGVRFRRHSLGQQDVELYNLAEAIPAWDFPLLLLWLSVFDHVHLSQHSSVGSLDWTI